MTQKTLLQGLAMAAVFFAIWLGLSKIDFVGTSRASEARGHTEQRLGNLVWKTIKETETVVKDDSITRPIEKLFRHICKSNDIDADDIKIHVIQKDEVNAFALPDGHLVVYTGLLADCENESELAGVLGHELAHIEKDHVMKKLVKEFGFALLVNISTGGRGGAMAHEMLQTLTSSAYDRRLESEADSESVDYLENANLDPEKFAEFLYAMSRKQNLPSVAYWMTTHPDSESRALAIIEKSKHDKHKVEKVLTVSEWNAMKGK